MIDNAVFFLLMLASPHIQVHGHRGARAVLPENTLPAFEHAITSGADAIELDLAVTRDNVLVVSHDPVFNRHLCQGAEPGRMIRKATLAEVQRWDCGALKNSEFPRQQPVPGTRIPTLEEVFALASRGNFVFNIEMKSFPDRPEYTPPPGEFARMVYEAIRRHGLEKRVLVQSFDFRCLRAMRQLAPGIPLSALIGASLKSFASIAGEAHAGIISPHFRLVTPEKVKAAHAAGIKVLAWTANTPEQWKRLVEAGVDGIITDDPAGLIQYLNSLSSSGRSSPR